MSRQRSDAAYLSLRHCGMVCEVEVGQQRVQRAPAPSKAEAVYREHASVMVNGVARIAGLGVFARQRFAHNHPQRIGNGGVVSARKHKSVGVGMLRMAVVIAQSAHIRPRQVQRHGVGRVCQRPAEVSGLRVVAQQHQRHSREEAHILHSALIVLRQFNGRALSVGG